MFEREIRKFYYNLRIHNYKYFLKLLKNPPDYIEDIDHNTLVDYYATSIKESPQNFEKAMRIINLFYIRSFVDIPMLNFFSNDDFELYYTLIKYNYDKFV